MDRIEMTEKEWSLFQARAIKLNYRFPRAVPSGRDDLFGGTMYLFTGGLPGAIAQQVLAQIREENKYACRPTTPNA